MAPVRSLRSRQATERSRASSSIIERLSEIAVPKAPKTCAIAAMRINVQVVATSISMSVIPRR